MNALLTRLTSALFGRKPTSSREGRSAPRARPGVEALEARDLPAFSLYGPLPLPGLLPGVTPTPAPVAPPPLRVPALSSNPTAAAKLYLDFDGHSQATWQGYGVPAILGGAVVGGGILGGLGGGAVLGGVVGGIIGGSTFPAPTTPVFSLDADRTTFSQRELDVIRETWARVSEDFAPFNIDVTTVNPGDFSDGKALRVSIGGNAAWLGRRVNGTALIGSFAGMGSNTAFAFTDNIGTDPARIAKVVSHEAGHAFGLRHYPQSNATDPSSLPNNPFPLMRQRQGFAVTTRTTWQTGRNEKGDPQDDMAVIGGARNGFGYRADDHGDSVANATWLPTRGETVATTFASIFAPRPPSSGTVRASGIIGRTTDADYFAFWTGGGTARFVVNVAALGANLDAQLELRDARGNLIQAAAPGDNLGATIERYLPRGTYHLVVRSQGSYGDVGQYTLEGTGISTVGYTTTGPRVISSPATVVSRFAAATFTLTFDKPMSVASLNPSHLTLVSPTGRQLRPLSVEPVPGRHGGRVFLVRVLLPERGTYRLTVGPGVTDEFGNRLDQNGDGTPDGYSAPITRILLSPSPLGGLSPLR